MSTLAKRRKKGLKLMFIILAFIPWIAINYYWVRIGELRNPIWMLLINLFIAFFAFGAPAIDRGFRKKDSVD